MIIDKEDNKEVNENEVSQEKDIPHQNKTYITREELLEILNEKSAEYKDMVHKVLNDYNKKEQPKEIVDIPKKETNIEF